MKKNFLKKLAFTMAFATVFTTLAPAAGVFAASKPSLNVGKKLTLLLGTEREEFDINVKNKVSGSKYEWTTSNKKVATVDKAGVVEGQAVGSAKVTLKITLPTKKTATLSTTVDVKDNIKEVAINNAPKEALKVGQEYDFNRTIVETFGGNTKAHKGAVTRWFLNDTKTATINDSGVFKATEVGEYEVTAKSFQSVAKYNEYLKSGNAELVTATSETVKVTVVPSIVSVAQKTATKFEVVFDANMKELVNKDNLVITNKAGVKLSIVKDVKFDDAGKVATVETYINLVDKEVYTVSYKELAKEFVASVGEIATIAITEPSVVAYNQPTDVKVKYFDANGIEVSGNNANLEVKIVSGNGWVDPSTNKITLFNIGDSVTIKATYKTGKFDTNWNEIVLTSGEFVVTAVESLAATTNAIKVWTIADAGKVAKDVDYAKVVTSLPLNAVNTKAIYVKGVNTSNNDVFEGFTFESTDTSKLIVDPNTGKLLPVSTGTVSVIVKNGKYQTVISVTITAKAEAANFTADKNAATVSSTIDQKAVYTVTLKDQYGDQINVDPAKVKVTSLARPTGVSEADANALLTGVVTDGKYVATFTTTDGVTKDGDYTYRLETEGRATVITVKVTSGDKTKVTSYRISVDATSTDVVINKNNTGNKTITATVYGYDVKGTPVVDVTSGAVLKATLTSDSSVTVTGSVINFTNASKTGTYVVTGEVTINGTKHTLVSTAFEVKNSQVKAVVAREKAQIEAATVADVLAKLAAQGTGADKVFTVTSKASDVTSTLFTITASDIQTTFTDSSDNGTYPVLVKSINVTETFDGGNTVTYKLDVNQVINVIKK